MPATMQIELGFCGNQRVNAVVTNSQRKTPTMTTTNHTPIRARFARKPYSLDEVLHNSDPSAPLEPIEIAWRKELTEAEYDAFASTLLQDRDWLAGLGGHAAGRRRVVAVSAPGRRTLFVDPSGGSYGRYGGMAEAMPAADDEQAGAIAWQIDNRRPEVSREQAIRTLRRALAGDPAASRILDRLDEQ
jgi:hypothetical protein